MSNTLWNPRLSRDAAPIYRAIADALERDVAEGVLREGSRLPTHRELASKLGVTPLTITRAYKEASRRGLIDSTVGRGTYVRTLPPTESTGRSESGFLDLSKNIIEGGERIDLDAAAILSIRGFLQDATYQPTEGAMRHRVAAAAWMERSGVPASPDRTVITPGAQPAIVSILGALCSPGDTILAEELTYPRLPAIASLLHVNVAPVELDEHGIVPSSLDRACRKSWAKALYTIPTLQNPTGTVMPEKRRREIVTVAKRHGIQIIEDDVYGFLREEGSTPFAALLPEQASYVTSISKSVTPSLRLGFAHLPVAMVERVTASFGAMTAFTSSVGAELFASMLESGAADQSVEIKRATIRANRAAAERALGELAGTADPMSPHLWINLPERCDARELADRARFRNIGISPASAFAIHRSTAPNAARLSIGATRDAKQLEASLRLLASLITDTRFNTTTVV